MAKYFSVSKWIRKGLDIYNRNLGGRVGIGTTDPQAKLHIDGDVIFDTDTGANKVYITRLGATNQTTEIYTDDWRTIFKSVQDEVSAGGLIFDLGGDGSGARLASFYITRESNLGNPPSNILVIVKDNGRVGIGVAEPACRLQVAGAIATKTLTHSAAGPTDNLNVLGVNTIFIDAGANAVIIGGLVGGVRGQALQIVIIDPTNDVTLEHIEGAGNQDLYLHAGIDETIDGHYGGWNFVCDGNNWYDASHAKHV